jgi:hypothetical protein
MWQPLFTYALARQKDLSFILALYGKYVYLPVPPHPFHPESLRVAFSYMKEVNGPGTGISRVEGLSETQKTQAEEWGYPVRLSSSEYLYDRKILAGLHGDPYRSRRNEINRLVKDHSVVLRPYRKSDLKSCGDLFEIWKSQRLPLLKGELGEKMLLSSQKAHLQVLLQGEDWGMDAWVVVLENRLSAYSVGAPLDPATYGLFLEVTDLTVKGLSAYIFTNICRQVEPYSLINTGDAQGLPGLAQSKEHWHPLRQVQTYAADPKM